jgi:hypothetical protein
VILRAGDLQDLAAKTSALIADPLRRYKIGQQARDFALLQTREQWVRAYEAVLSQTATGRATVPSK